MNDKTTQDPIYDLKSVKLPHLSGAALRLFATLLEGPLGSLLIPSLFRSSGVSWLREQQFDEPARPERQAKDMRNISVNVEATPLGGLKLAARATQPAEASRKAK